jgi:hypothetical protein
LAGLWWLHNALKWMKCSSWGVIEGQKKCRCKWWTIFKAWKWPP